MHVDLWAIDMTKLSDVEGSVELDAVFDRRRLRPEQKTAKLCYPRHVESRADHKSERL